jgi:hemoglobin
MKAEAPRSGEAPKQKRGVAKMFRRIPARAAGVLLLSALAMQAAEAVQKGSLYDRLGGRPAVTAVVNSFLKRMLADDRVNPWFGHLGNNPEHAAAYKAKLHDFICQAAGGPCKYEGKDMFAAHKGRHVTSDAFQAVVEDLVATLDEFKVPEKEKGQLLGLLAPIQTAVVQQ